MNKKFAFPKRFWVFLCLTFVLAFLLIGNVFRTNSWTGDKPFSEFTQNDWKMFLIFVLEEVIILAVIILFALLLSKISKIKTMRQWQSDKFSGINREDYDYVWFDFAMTERALILKDGDTYKLYVQEYNEKNGEWDSLNSVSIYQDLSKLKKALFYEFDFFCEENAELDEHGDEIFKVAE